MTTPTTPAAAVSLDDLAGQLLECIADTPWLTCNVAKSVVRSAAEELRIATARESALIADRDAIRAAARQFYNLTIADPDVLIRAFTESKREAIIETGRVLAAALAAPAMEGV